MIAVERELLAEAYRRVGLAAPDRPSPPERIRLLAAIAPQLLALSEPGRLRLEAWRAERSRSAPDATPAALRRQLRRDLAFFGDAPVLEVVLDALCLVPPPVRALILEEVAVVSVGWTTCAWTSGAKLLGPDGEPRASMIVLSGGAPHTAGLGHTFLHEVVHVWEHDPRFSLDVAVPAIGSEGLAALACEQGWAERAAAVNADAEWRAEVLAQAWQCAAQGAPEATP